jgi:hypothetical protein
VALAVIQVSDNGFIEESVFLRKNYLNKQKEKKKN